MEFWAQKVCLSVPNTYYTETKKNRKKSADTDNNAWEGLML